MCFEAMKEKEKGVGETHLFLFTSLDLLLIRRELLVVPNSLLQRFDDIILLVHMLLRM